MLIAKGLSETDSVVSRERTEPGHEGQKNMKQLLLMKPAHQEFPETQRNTKHMLAISSSVYCRIYETTYLSNNTDLHLEKAKKI